MLGAENNFALGNTTTVSTIRLPTLVYVYSGATCANLQYIYEFPKGIAAAAFHGSTVPSRSLIIRNSSGAVQTAYTDQLSLVRAIMSGTRATLFLKDPI